jgi:hypothetical protein
MTADRSHASIERLIESIVREVVAELMKRGVVSGSPGVAAREKPAQHTLPGSALEIDMSAYRTPVLTENHLARIDPTIATIIVPCNTVVTPGARILLRSKKLELVRKIQSH